MSELPAYICHNCLEIYRAFGIFQHILHLANDFSNFRLDFCCYFFRDFFHISVYVFSITAATVESLKNQINNLYVKIIQQLTLHVHM